MKLDGKIRIYHSIASMTKYARFIKDASKENERRLEDVLKSTPKRLREDTKKDTTPVKALIENDESQSSADILKKKRKMVEAARIALASKEVQKQASTGLVQYVPSRFLRSPLKKA